MPWCVGCDRFLSPSTVAPDGTCPRCGQPVDPGAARAPVPAASESEEPATVVAGPAGEPPPTGGDAEPMPLPWHFKLLVGAIALYLGWRAFQGVEWLAGRF